MQNLTFLHGLGPFSRHADRAGLGAGPVLRCNGPREVRGRGRRPRARDAGGPRGGKMGPPTRSGPLTQQNFPIWLGVFGVSLGFWDLFGVGPLVGGGFWEIFLWMDVVGGAEGGVYGDDV